MDFRSRSFRPGKLDRFSVGDAKNHWWVCWKNPTWWFLVGKKAGGFVKSIVHFIDICDSEIKSKLCYIILIDKF